MSNTPSTPKPSSFGEVRKFPAGYGQFPYLIIRMHYGVYMQIPIQLSPPEAGAPPRPGIQIPNLSPAQLAEYRANLDSEVHDLLVEHFRRWKQKTEFYNKGRKIECCIVEAPDRAYYFKEKEEHPMTAIPRGGTLLSASSDVIGMNVPHYLIPQATELKLSPEENS
jgi:hypothetical protein